MFYSLLITGILITCQASANTEAESPSEKRPTLLILGDSLSAGYRLSTEDNWPTLLNLEFNKLMDDPKNTLNYPWIINGSISGDTAEQALARLPNLLASHTPDYVLIELGANNGMQGLDVNTLKKTLEEIIVLTKQKGAIPILMQIDIPQNLGKRYVTFFKSVYPSLAKTHDIQLIPFYMTDLVAMNEHNDYKFLQEDGIHPTKEAQPFIVDWMMNHLVKAINATYSEETP